MGVTARDLLILSFFLLTVLKTTSTPTYLYSSCEKHVVDPNSTYQTNLDTLLHSLSSHATAFPPGGYFKTSVGKNINETVYGLFLCRGDQNATVCGDCVNTASKDDLHKVYCPGAKEAVIWYNECMLRYSNESFFGVLAIQPMGYIVGSESHIGNRTVYNNAMYTTMGDMLADTANDNSEIKFTTKVVKVTSSIFLYALQQCMPDLDPHDCRRCLWNAIVQLSLYSSSLTLSPSCYVQYESFPFYIGAVNYWSAAAANSPLIDSRDGSTTRGKKRLSHIKLFVAIPTTIALLSLLMIFLSRSIYMRKRKALEFEDNKAAEIDGLITEESLQFSLSRIRAATHNFSIDNKLGQGGFGEVYKGIYDGQEIAIKRLSKNSRQGVAEFKTEVLLVAKLQHKNLVKLLGYCVESMEKILIYEFLPNSSLDQILFGNIIISNV